MGNFLGQIEFDFNRYKIKTGCVSLSIDGSAFVEIQTFKFHFEVHEKRKSNSCGFNFSKGNFGQSTQIFQALGPFV